MNERRRFARPMMGYDLLTCIKNVLHYIHLYRSCHSTLLLEQEHMMVTAGRSVNPILPSPTRTSAPPDDIRHSMRFFFSCRPQVDWKRFAAAVLKAGGVDTNAKAARSCEEVWDRVDNRTAGHAQARGAWCHSGYVISSTYLLCTP